LNDPVTGQYDGDRGLDLGGAGLRQSGDAIGDRAQKSIAGAGGGNTAARIRRSSC
jgi:hypothetical protein